MHHDKLHSKQALQAFASPWSPEAPSNAKGPFSCPCRQSGGTMGRRQAASAQMAERSELSSVISPVPTFCSLTATRHDCLLYTKSVCHSGFVCFLKFSASNFIPGAPLSHSRVLLSFFSWATYKFPKIRKFNGSADSA